MELTLDKLKVIVDLQSQLIAFYIDCNDRSEQKIEKHKEVIGTLVKTLESYGDILTYEEVKEFLK